MPAGDETIRFEVVDGGSGITIGDQNVESAEVPEGEIWYVDMVYWSRKDGSTSGPGPDEVSLGIFDPASAHANGSEGFDTNSPRVTRDTSPTGVGTLSYGAYAHGGAVVAVGADNPIYDGLVGVLIRRVA